MLYCLVLLHIFTMQFVQHRDVFFFVFLFFYQASKSRSDTVPKKFATNRSRLAEHTQESEDGLN